jgi:hypothetical protein
VLTNKRRSSAAREARTRRCLGAVAADAMAVNDKTRLPGPAGVGDEAEQSQFSI